MKFCKKLRKYVETDLKTYGTMRNNAVKCRNPHPNLHNNAEICILLQNFLSACVKV